MKEVCIIQSSDSLVETVRLGNTYGVDNIMPESESHAAVVTIKADDAIRYLPW